MHGLRAGDDDEQGAADSAVSHQDASVIPRLR